MKGRRVIFVLGNLELGGAERQALILAKHLIQHEHAEVAVWGFNRTGPVAEICAQFRIPSRVVPLQQPFDLRKLTHMLRAARPDILLPYTLVPNVVCGLMWQRTGARLCVWNQRDEGIFNLNAKWQRRAAQITPQFIANSHAGSQYLVEQLNVNLAKIRVIPNGIELANPQSDRRSWRNRLELDDTTFVACMIANVHANKDHVTLLRAWRLVVNALEQRAVLVLAGRHYGAYESLAALTNELDIANNVRFTGPVSDVAGLLTAVDLGVFSSRSEGCPNGVLECMAAGLAIAATDIEAIREVVGEHGTRLLAPPGDAERLAQIIIELAKHPETRTTIGAANQSQIKARYNAQRMCEDTVALLTT